MGRGTRSELKSAIRRGNVSVDGKIVRDPGFHVSGEEAVLFCGQPVVYEEMVYYLMNKPAGVISASEDPHTETVVDLIAEPKRKDLFPVGRLDKDTEGLLIITNDGALAHRLLAPGKHVDKVYEAEIEGIVTEADVEIFAEGLKIDEDVFGQNLKTSPSFTALPAKLEILSVDEQKKTSRIRITIREGKYHQIKRMFHAVGKEVAYLKRISMGPITLDPSLAPGEYRYLTDAERELLQV